jgi:hypothetical protein
MDSVTRFSTSGFFHQPTPPRALTHRLKPKSIYNVEEKANVVGVRTDFIFKIFGGKLLDVAPKSRLADGLVTDYSRWSGCDFVDCKDG